MKSKNQKPLEKIVLTQGKLQMFVTLGDVALDGQTPQEFASEVLEAFQLLMEFRNMVSAMSKLDEAPSEAVLAYIDTPSSEAVL